MATRTQGTTKPRMYAPKPATAPAPPEPVTICALDISTWAVGLAVVRFGASAADRSLPPEVFVLESFRPLPSERVEKAKGVDCARIGRIRQLRSQVRERLARYQYEGGASGIEAVAYEQPNMRGAGATAAIHQAIGAVLSVGYLSGLPLYPVNSSQAKAAAGIRQFRAKGQTAATLGEKGAAVAWADRAFGIDLHARFGEDAEHVADALAVAWAAWDKIRTGKAVRK